MPDLYKKSGISRFYCFDKSPFTHHWLILNSTSKHAYKLAQLTYLLLVDTLVDGIAFNKILFLYLSCPYTKSRTAFALNTIAHRDDDVKVI